MGKKLKIELILEEGNEIIERDIKKFGNASHIILPQKQAGKKAFIIIGKIKKL
jgi:putative transposon-encoded protein